jgi:cytidine deaminase
MKTISITSQFSVFGSFNYLTTSEHDGTGRGCEKKSICTYSKFRVGAALLLDNGQTVLGSNQENAAYPSGLCARTCIFFQAGAIYPEAKILKWLLPQLPTQ